MRIVFDADETYRFGKSWPDSMLSGHFIEVEFDGKGDLVDFELFDLNETTNERESCSTGQVPSYELEAMIAAFIGTAHPVLGRDQKGNGTQNQRRHIQTGRSELGGKTMNATQKEYDDREYEDRLTDIFGEVQICGMTFDSGRALHELDPIAFNCARNDEEIVWICGECNAEYETEDEAEECCKPDEDEEADEVTP